jgi:excisionase family DNA binding protein
MTEPTPPGILTVRDAADEVGRTPETIRRWVWSGRLPASKRGNRLTVARDDLERVAGRASRSDLAAWADQVAAQRAARAQGETRSAADLVLADRRRRASSDARHAGR